MKWSIFILILLGLFAAAAAAVMTASLRARAAQAKGFFPSREVSVLIARKSLTPHTILNADAVETRTLSPKRVPEGALSNPAEAVGKFLTVPVVAGQALTRACFAPEGSGAGLTMMLQPGMRAVTLSLAYSACLEGLLYPGCRVDVLSSFKLQRQEQAPGEAISTTLLENVQVLAIESRMVGKVDKKEEEGAKKNGGQSRCTLVTLMVDSQQAKALQLATEFGSISLAMRNPGDAKPIDKDATLLSEGKLAQMAQLLEASVSDKKAPGERVLVKNLMQGLNLGEQKPPPAIPEPEKQPDPMWDVTIIHGSKTETQSFPMK
jgi:pilus assembly protein CpaB